MQEFFIKDLIQLRKGEEHSLHEKYVNPQMRKVLKTIGFDKHYVRGEGSYLFDDKGNKYLDLLSGYGVFNMGRNHPVIKKALKEAVDLNLPSLVQMDDHLLSGLLAEKLIQITPKGLNKVFFNNSGAEAVETAIKLARGASKKSAIIYCDHAFHGLTLGALSVNGGDNFKEGFGPLLPDCRKIPFNDPAALESELAKGDVAAFIVEPVQGKGVHIPDETYFPRVRELCTKYGAYLIMDEIQMGMGRTGCNFACEHWDITPDMLLVAKSLSGGMVPVGATIMTDEIYNKVFSSMDRCVIHSSTFAQNSLAMVCGLAALHILESENLAEQAKDTGNYLLNELKERIGSMEMVKEVRGLGMVLAVEFEKPKSTKLKIGWDLLHKASGGLFPQIIIMPLMDKYKILSQVAGHDMDIIKFLPPLNLTRKDADYFLDAMEDVVKEAHKFPGSLFGLGKKLVSNIVKIKS